MVSGVPPDTTIWVLTDGKAGDETQCLGITAALGIEPTVKRVTPRPPWVWLGPFARVAPADRPDRPGSPIAPPFPDMVIASGRRVAPYVKAIKEASSGRTFTVILKDPRTGRRAADFLWVPAHDRLRGANVLATLTSPHRISAEVLAAERAAMRPEIAALPEPRVAVLIGGPSKDFRYSDADMARLAGHLQRLAQAGASLMVTVSRRTPASLTAIVRAALAPRPHLLHDGSGDNPYPAFLAAAEAIVVTADSVNMVGEAAATGAPILLFEPSGGSAKIRRFLKGLARHGAVRPFTGVLERFSYPPLDATPEITAEIARRYAAHRAAIAPAPLHDPNSSPDSPSAADGRTAEDAMTTSANPATAAKVVIIGSGPAGYTAAIYAARAMLKPILIQGMQPGGQLTVTTEIENYPGFAEPVQGPWLMEQMQAQAEHVGARIVTDLVTRVDLSKRPFRLECDSGEVYLADTLVIATGAQAKWLGLPSETAFRGFGVSACATCDGFFFRNKNVMVVGGGNTAVEEALFLTHFAAKVTLVHRRDSFRAEKILQERLFANPKVEVVWNHQVEEILGSDNPPKVAAVRLANVETGETQERPVDGVFVAIGHAPATALFEGQLKMKPNGYLWVAPYSTATSVPGVFAAGDVTDDLYRQAVTAAGMGCMAALEVERFLAAEGVPAAAAAE